MLIKILGAIDLLAGATFLFALGIGVNTTLLLYLGIILLMKSSLGMLKDFASWVDILSGICLLLLIFFNLPSILLIIFAALLIQTGVFSLV